MTACPVCRAAPCAPDRPTCSDWGCVLVDDQRRHDRVGEDRFDRERDEGQR